MVVAEVMTSPVVSIGPNESIDQALRLMRAGNCRRLPVLDGDNLVGIITDRDLRLATNSPLVLNEKWYSDFILESVKVKACMTSDPITVDPATPVLEAIQIMRRRKIGGLPVVDVQSGGLVGIITTTDLLDFLIRLLEGDE